MKLWCIGLEGESTNVGPDINSCWLDRLPDELLGMILRHASGIADVDAYIDGANSGVYRLDLELMSEFVSVMSADVSHVCRRWRRTIAPAFYHYVMYDDYEDCLVAPEGCEQHVRWLLVHMPDDVSSFRSIVQDLYRLPLEVRSRVLWLGLCMGYGTAMSVSKCGPLAEAFPSLRQIWLDISHLNTMPRDVFAAVVGAKVLAPVTALVLRDMLWKQAPVLSLVRAAAATLVHLDLLATDICDVCKVLWGPDGQDAGSEPLFPRLTRLFMTVSVERDILLPTPPRASPFPELQVLVCHEDSRVWDRRTYEARYDCMRGFVTVLLELAPTQLRRLSIGDLDGTALGIISGKMLRLETLHLVRRHPINSGRDGSSNSNSSNSHSSLERILEMVVAMSELKVLTPIAGFLYNRPLLEPSCPSLPHLRALDISSWLLTLCDLQLLLSKLLCLEEARVALTQPQTRPALEDISGHRAMQRLLIVNDLRCDAKWDEHSLESLTTLLARMPRLSEALLFSEAVKWLTAAMAARNRDDLLYLEHHVQIGRSDN